MKVQYGSDITKVTHGIIAHGVNCQNRMGSGVAKALYTKWPEVKEWYHEYPSEQVLGNMMLVPIDPPDLYVANCYTQDRYGYDGDRYASTVAINRSLETLTNIARALKLEVHMPMLGCGLGGLHWETEVEPIVYLMTLAGVKVTVHELNLR